MFAINDDEAMRAFHDLCRFEGIIPALESSHALAHAAKIAPTMRKDQVLLVNLSGRGDKDINTVAAICRGLHHESHRSYFCRIGTT